MILLQKQLRIIDIYINELWKNFPTELLAYDIDTECYFGHEWKFKAYKKQGEKQEFKSMTTAEDLLVLPNITHYLDDMEE